MFKSLLYIFIYSILNTLLFVNTCFAQEIPSFEMSYFEDVNSNLTLETVRTKDFTPVPDHILSLGITKSTAWVKLDIDKTQLQEDLVIEVDRSFLDEITLFYSTETFQEQDVLGIMTPQSENKLDHYVPTFIIPAGKLTSSEIYLKVKSRWSMLIPISIKPKETFYKDRTIEYLIAGLLIGGLLLMGIYNLFLYFSTKDFSYILYVVALYSAILSQGYIFGILIPYLSPESPEFSFRFPIFIMAITGIFCSLFTIRFLEIKKSSRLFYILLLIGITSLLSNMVIELLHFDYLSRKVNIISIIGTALIIFSSAIYSLIKGKKIAIYFTIAWTFYLFGMIVFALKTVGILPHNSFTEHFMHVGTFMEVMLLSFALGHKYSLVRIEKERLEQQTKEELELLVKQQTVKLEASVEEKEILLKEIHHRVKNNLQIIISLLDLQVASVKNTKNKEALSQSKSRVYSMSLIHQKLYQSNNLAHVNVKSYLEELFTYIQNSYSNTSQKTTYALSIDDKEISLTQAVPLGLIVNELLTNSFKYGGLPNEENRIKLSLRFHNNNLELTIADSGLGFDEKALTYDIKKSLGLFLVKSLLKQLRGTINRFHKDEMFVTTLTFPINDETTNASK